MVPVLHDQSDHEVILPGGLCDDVFMATSDAASERESIRRGLGGLGDAWQRLAQAGAKYHFVPLTEFCWWAISLDDLLPGVIADYASKRDADEDGRVVSGLRYVRNALGHAGLVVTRTEGGLSLPISLPLTVNGPLVAYWVEAIDLAVDLPQPKNQERYEQWVAGRELRTTTYQARRWLESQVAAMDRESGYNE